jgi:hypothetical protein
MIRIGGAHTNERWRRPDMFDPDTTHPSITRVYRDVVDDPHREDSVGVRACARISIPGRIGYTTVITICSSGIWGVGDSDEAYWDELYVEQRDELIGMLKALRLLEVPADLTQLESPEEPTGLMRLESAGPLVSV